MNKVLRVGILGGGRMAQKHATAIRLQPAAKLVAVADPLVAIEELRARFGADVNAYADAEQLLASEKPDVVHIVTPPATHFELACRCLSAGVNVYVEKPFALSAADASAILNLAEKNGLRACAAHQVLFQQAGQHYQSYLPTIGEIVHIESYFSFKPVRRRPDGGAPISAIDQLVDILPHPVYLLLSSLESQSDAACLTAVDVDPDGEVRAVIRCGKTLASLIVTLRGRPIESYLRVVGVNGAIEADFILGGVVKLLGPGASAPSVVTKPFSQATQQFFGSAASLARLLFRPQKSYPGLGELLQLFYRSVADHTHPPTSRQAIVKTVEICEQITQRLTEADRHAEDLAKAEFERRSSALPLLRQDLGPVVVTGGTGMLGRKVLAELRSSGRRVFAPVRRLPSARNKIAGVEYMQADLGDGLALDVLAGADIVVHLAAETAGNLASHQRNTVTATGKLLDAMQASGVRRLINISSVAVLKPGAEPMNEESEVDNGNLSRGPYVWAKAEAERLAVGRAASNTLEVKTIRLGPLVDYSDFAAPGRLGREVARLYVAMGSRSSPLSVCDVATAAKVISYATDNFAATPNMVNLLEVPAPTRGELAERLRRSRPDLRFIWLPFPILRAMSLLAVALQKLMRPGKPALNVYSAFKAEKYDTRLAQTLISAGGPKRH